jgi:hypothetical protein
VPQMAGSKNKRRKKIVSALLNLEGGIYRHSKIYLDMRCTRYKSYLFVAVEAGADLPSTVYSTRPTIISS